ncbi:hypothetical protein H6792_02400 [Candidatus Nomurabacteria bacterium]|nr:hypothetical protein [Candidatus Nomurabacteria bacterium]
MNSGHISFITKGKINSTGIHQKMDRIAYQVFGEYADRHLAGKKFFFPKLSKIIYFEGYNGPDGLKVKKGSSPYDKHHMWEPKKAEGHLMDWIEYHYTGLVSALKSKYALDSSFEASWLAHYLGDIVTPAHHYSKDILYLEKTTQHQTLNTKLSEQYRVTKNFADHIIFESGIASSLVLRKFNHIRFSDQILNDIQSKGLKTAVNNLALKIQAQGLYDQYLKKGWSPKLYKQIRSQVVDQGIQLIAAVWYQAVLDSRD